MILNIWIKMSKLECALSNREVWNAVSTQTAGDYVYAGLPQAKISAVKSYVTPVILAVYHWSKLFSICIVLSLNFCLGYWHMWPKSSNDANAVCVPAWKTATLCA